MFVAMTRCRYQLCLSCAYWHLPVKNSVLPAAEYMCDIYYLSRTAFNTDMYMIADSEQDEAAGEALQPSRFVAEVPMNLLKVIDHIEPLPKCVRSSGAPSGGGTALAQRHVGKIRKLDHSGDSGKYTAYCSLVLVTDTHRRYQTMVRTCRSSI